MGIEFERIHGDQLIYEIGIWDCYVFKERPLPCVSVPHQRLSLTDRRSYLAPVIDRPPCTSRSRTSYSTSSISLVDSCLLSYMYRVENSFIAQGLKG